jgi:hypothetical protein
VRRKLNARERWQVSAEQNSQAPATGQTIADDIFSCTTDHKLEQELLETTQQHAEHR